MNSRKVRVGLRCNSLRTICGISSLAKLLITPPLASRPGARLRKISRFALILVEFRFLIASYHLHIALGYSVVSTLVLSSRVRALCGFSSSKPGIHITRASTQAQNEAPRPASTPWRGTFLILASLTLFLCKDEGSR
jgi:hypothetical protein